MLKTKNNDGKSKKSSTSSIAALEMTAYLDLVIVVHVDHHIPQNGLQCVLVSVPRRFKSGEVVCTVGSNMSVKILNLLHLGKLYKKDQFYWNIYIHPWANLTISGLIDVFKTAMKVLASTLIHLLALWS